MGVLFPLVVSYAKRKVNERNKALQPQRQILQINIYFWYVNLVKKVHINGFQINRSF